MVTSLGHSSSVRGNKVGTQSRNFKTGLFGVPLVKELKAQRSTAGDMIRTRWLAGELTLSQVSYSVQDLLARARVATVDWVVFLHQWTIKTISPRTILI